MLLLLLLTTVLLLQLETLSEEEEKGAIDKETIGHFLVTRPRKSDQDLSEEAVKLFKIFFDPGNSNPRKALRIKGEQNGFFLEGLSGRPLKEQQSEKDLPKEQQAKTSLPN